MSVSITPKIGSNNVTPTVTSFTLANNQSTPANITGFTVNSASCLGFYTEYSIARRYTGSSQSSGLDTAFNTNLGTGVGGGNIASSSAVQSNGQILVGGTFATYNGSSTGSLVRLNTNGTIDSAFQTALGTGFVGNIVAIAVQPNQQIVVVGNFLTLNGSTLTNKRIIRLNANGSVDTTFQTNVGTGFNAQVDSIALQSNGQILIGGQFTNFNGNGRNFLVRLNSDGTEDSTFYTNTGGPNGYIKAIAVQANQQIVLGNDVSTYSGIALSRLNTDGTPDISFISKLGSGIYQSGGSCLALVVQPNQQIIVAGSFSVFNGKARNNIIRLNPDGSEDANQPDSFNTNIGSGSNAGIDSILLTETNSIILGGTFSTFNGNTRNGIIKLNTDGTEDTGFYSGLGTGTAGGGVLTLSLESNNNIFLGGSFTSFDSATPAAVISVIDDLVIPSSELLTQGVIRGNYSPATTSWELGGQNSRGDQSGIVFSMTSSGQMQYTSTNLLGTLVQSQINFLTTSI